MWWICGSASLEDLRYNRLGSAQACRRAVCWHDCRYLTFDAWYLRRSRQVVLIVSYAIWWKYWHPEGTVEQSTDFLCLPFSPLLDLVIWIYHPVRARLPHSSNINCKHGRRRKSVARLAVGHLINLWRLRAYSYGRFRCLSRIVHILLHVAYLVA